MQDDFAALVLTPAGTGDPALAVAAQRAGHLGVLNAELPLSDAALRAALDTLAAATDGGFGLALPDPVAAADLTGDYAGRGLGTVILPAEAALAAPEAVAAIRAAGVAVLPEAIRWDDQLAGPVAADGLILKG